MTTPLSKLQLNAVLSALDGQPRNPNSRQAALKRIARHAETLGLDLDTLLTMAQGLIDGRMDAAAFVATLRAPDAGTEEPGMPHDQPPTADPAERHDERPDPSSDASAPGEDAHQVPRCPTCGRRMRRVGVQGSAHSRPGTHRDGSWGGAVRPVARPARASADIRLEFMPCAARSASSWSRPRVRRMFAAAAMSVSGAMPAAWRGRG